MNLDEAIGIANEMLLENKDSACTFYDVFSAERAEAVEILIQSGLEQVERARGQRDGSETTQRVEARMNKPNSKTAVAPWTDANRRQVLIRGLMLAWMKDNRPDVLEAIRQHAQLTVPLAQRTRLENKYSEMLKKCRVPKA